MKKPLTAVVTENSRLSGEGRPPEEDTRHIVLTTPGFKYLPGQSLGVLPPGFDERSGRPNALRLYSIASPSEGDDGKGDSVSLTVVRHFWSDEDSGRVSVPGVCSQYLCDLNVGAEVQCTGPVGKRFLLPTDFQQRDMIFIATGTGIAPFRAFLMKMWQDGYQGKATLIFGARYEDTLLYDEQFKQMAAEHDNFSYHTALSRGGESNPVSTEISSPRDRMYAHVRLWMVREQIKESLTKPDTLIYVCGIKGMETGIEAAIDKMGLEMGEDDGLYHRMHKDESRILLEVY